jgi:hypothetical protein
LGKEEEEEEEGSGEEDVSSRAMHTVQTSVTEIAKVSG